MTTPRTNTGTSAETVAGDRSKHRVLIFDTTLRDGEQAPGCSMTIEEKLEVAQMLARMGVDIIEAGFPIASPGDFEAVLRIASTVEGATIAALARAKRQDIDRAAEALAPAKSRRIHTFIATSPLHMKYKLQMEPEAVLEAITESVTHARNKCDDVEWSAEDGTRSDFEFLCRAVEAAIKAGATTINIPDTVGYSVPEEFGELFANLIAQVPDSDKAIFSAHGHNDLGLGVANALAAIQGGARQVECTINGIGERAGNFALEEIVMALRVRSDVMPFTTGIDTTFLTKASRLVSSVTGSPVQPNKAIVGVNAFAHESGIHQDGMLKNSQTYEIMTPESVGLSRTNLVMGKHSGRHAFKAKLAELGIDAGDNQLNELFSRFKDLADHKKEVFDEDILALADDSRTSQNNRIKLLSLAVSCGTKGPQTAEIELDIDGTRHLEKAEGNGPVDALFLAVGRAFPSKASLQLYEVHAITGGTDAQAEVSVRLELEGRVASGRGADPDTLVASAKAYINALNRLIAKAGAAGDNPKALSA